MKCGGTMQKGGAMKKMKDGGQPLLTKTMPGYNANTNTMKKGGNVKPLAKAQMGTVVKDNKKIQKESAKRVKKGFKPVSGPSFKKGGATSFGMLSVKAGIDKNPKPTAADRIAGAKKKK